MHAAVTICSINYLAKALVLFDSYKNHHPNHNFYLIIVDRKSSDININKSGLNIIWVEDLHLPNFLQHAFAYDVIELNTNVKPAALSFILKTHDSVVYLDPDIKIYAPLNNVFEELVTASFVVTPHYNTPILDGSKPDDIELLKFGAFNLGFIGISQCAESFAFLEWWSERCLSHGFYEPQLGLAVDQKWVGIAPCFFPHMKILHDEGLNVAFWNLHERNIDLLDGALTVNGDTVLKFIHFSSFNENHPNIIANKQNRYAKNSRPDFSNLAYLYAQELLLNSSEGYSNVPYGFDYFEDGVYITPALRRFYSQLKLGIFRADENPFLSNSPVRDFAKKHHLLSAYNGAGKRNTFRDLNSYGLQIKIINKLLRISLFMLGPERYFNLMRYLGHISSLRNQVDMFGHSK